MPEYLSPGVYVEEVSSGIKPIEGVGTSTGAFIGIAEKGPIGGVNYGGNDGVGRPVLITNFGEFQRNFGGFISGEFLAYAVQQFFGEGGTRCYVLRTAHFTTNAAGQTVTDAVRATINLQNATPTNVLTVNALNEGEWGNRISVEVSVNGRVRTTIPAAVAAAAAGTATSAVFASVQGIEPGASLYLRSGGTAARVQVISVVAATNTVTFLALEPANLPAFAAGATVATTIPGKAASLVRTTAAPAATEVDLISVAGIEVGSILLFVREDVATPANTIEHRAVVTRVSGTRVTITPALNGEYTNGSVVTSEDYNLTVRYLNDIVEVFPNLSMENTNQTDYVQNRVNIGGSRSRYIRVVEIGNANVPPVNTTAPVALLNGANGGADVDTDYIGNSAVGNGFFGFDSVDDINILAAPGITLRPVILAGMSYCENRADCFYVAEAPQAAQTVTEVLDFKNASGSFAGQQALISKYGAIYWPWVRVLDPLTNRPMSMPPSGAVIGSYSATDVRRGVHKAPAGIEDGFLNTVIGIDKVVTKGEQDVLNPLGVNVIRSLPDAGIVIWGARTVSNDPEWRYINVRRLFLFLEESILKGTQWVVFEPNDRVLWKRIIRNISAFLSIQWQEGKLVGDKPEKAFFVKCDEETNPPESVDLGRVITLIGVAPSKPAEFVIFRISQSRGGSDASE